MIIGFDASRAQLGQRAGPENYTYHLLEGLLRIDRKNFYRLYVQPPISPHFLSHLSPPPSNFELKPISWPKLWTQGGLAGECLTRPPDVLFIPAHTIPLIRRPGLKTAVTIHDVGLQNYLAQYQRRWWRLYGGRISNFAARAATHVIAVSESTKRDLREKLGINPEKITVVYEGVDQNKFKVQSEKCKIDEVTRNYGIEGEYLLFVGTIQPRKNLVRLIEAFQESLNSQKSPTSLIIAGKKGWLSSEIYRAPKRCGVEDKVKFLGFVPTDDIVLLMNGARALVFPSLYEGFGLPVLEALACGCPVVTSNLSSLPEVVGEVGFLVDPYRVDDIARGIREVLAMDEHKRGELIQGGLQRVKQFTWERCARETLEVLEKVNSHDREN